MFELKVRIACLLFLLFHSANACGQVGIDAEFAGFGARAMAMGSAFIGMSDDATASEFNPAGLIFLERPELAIQTSYMGDKHEELQPVSYGQWLMQGAAGPGPRAEEHSHYWTPSFFSLTYPTDWAVISVCEYSPIFFKRRLRDSGGATRLVRDWRAQLTNYGVSMAFVAHPKLYLGATAKYGDFHYRQTDCTLAKRSGTSFHGNSMGGNFGFLLRPHRLFSIGGVYKTSQRLRGSYGANRLHLKVPRTMGLGLAFHPNDRLRVLADVDHIEWSEFLEERNSLQPNFDRDDVLRYHLGAEYLLGVFGTKSPTAVFLRCGAMHEQSNRLYYHGNFQPLRRVMPKEDAVNHLSGGFGLARERYQIDFAVDGSSKGMQYILSTVLYF